MSLASKKAPEDITSGALFLAATIFIKAMFCHHPLDRGVSYLPPPILKDHFSLILLSLKSKKDGYAKNSVDVISN